MVRIESKSANLTQEIDAATYAGAIFKAKRDFTADAILQRAGRIGELVAIKIERLS